MVTLDSFKKLPLSKEVIKKYKSSCKALKHIKPNANGYLYIDKDDHVAALIAVNEKNSTNWITALEIFDPYKNNGLSYKLLDVATKDFKATRLTVRKNNFIAKHVYEKYGFKDYNGDEYMKYMELGNNKYTNENAINESNSIYSSYYHLSKINTDELKPSIPSNFLTKNHYENNLVKRVSFSPSINQCLMAMSRNITGEEFYVYIPENIESVKIVEPTKDQVPDVDITGEIWVLNNIKVKKLGKVRVIKDSGKDGHTYTYGNGQTAELYDWDYEMIEESNISENYTNTDNQSINESVLYHGSHSDIKKYIQPKNMSYNEDNYVFATPSKQFALFYAGNRWNDDEINQSVYNNKIYLTELKDGALNKIFNTNGYIYTVPSNSFKQYKNHKNEFISSDKVEYTNKTYIKNILEELKKSGVVINKYPNKPDWWSKVMSKKQSVNEGMIYNGSDICYRYEDFKSGDLNVLLVLGQPGCDKDFSIELAKRHDAVWVALDHALFNKDYYNIEDLKVGDSVMYAFFKSSRGSRFFMTQEEAERTYGPFAEYAMKVLSNALFFILHLAREYENEKFVVDCNHWLSTYFAPDMVSGLGKECAIIIKGGSALHSKKVVKHRLTKINIIHANDRNEDKHLMELAKKREIYIDEWRKECLKLNAVKVKNRSSLLEEFSVINDMHIYLRIMRPRFDEYATFDESFRHDKEKNDVISIKKSLSDKDKDNLNITNNDFSTTANRYFIEYDGKTPVAYFIIDNGENGDADVSLAVRPEYQSKGYGTKVANRAMDYINKNLDRYNKIYWATKPDNIASQKLAKKCGFSIVRDDKQWKTYALDCHKIITDEFNMNEAYIFNEDNIYYNKDKFDSGEINLCFITGHSGSGKSTLAVNNAKADISDNTDWVSLDDVIFNKECHTLDEFKSDCKITYDFFTTDGKKFWCDREEALAYKGNYEDDIVRSFVEFAKTYANSHKNKKFIIEGVWLFHVFNPEELKDYTVYILGTSMIISKIRAAKRDSADAKNKITRAKAFTSDILFKKWKWYFIDEKKIAKYRDYYKKLTKEVLNETKRSELPDSSFGIPEDRKFPLDTEKHVRSAIHLFGHAEESKKKSLARRIYNAAKKYSVEIPKTTQCYKYLNEGVIEGLIPSGKDTIIFDMGSVLVDANTKEVLYKNPHIPDEYVEEIYEALRNNLFYIDDINLAKEIQQYDVSKAKKYLEGKTPDYINPYIDYVFDTFNKAMYKYPYVDSLLSTLRYNGYNIYFLSNWTRFSYIQEEQFFRPLLEKYFDGGLFSFQTKYMKPEREFFDILISKFHLDPSRCVFFDDNMENVIAGNSAGIYSVQFDKENTPKEILYSINNLNMNNEKTGEELLLSTDAGMTKINSSEITWWYLDKERLPSNTTKEEEQFYKTLDNAVKYYSEYYDITEPTELYVYTNAYNFSKSDVTPIALCNMGKISINENGDYEWLIHYPLHLNDNKLESLKEFMALNAINPIVGIRKPYVAVVQRYSTHKPELMFSNDIEGNNYLAVDDKNKFEIVTDSEIESINEVYKFIGNKAYIYRLEDRYTNKDYVSEKGIYGELTDKNLLSIDQLKFDESFEYIDFDLLEQKAITEASTIRRNIRGLLELNVYDHELIKSYKTEIPKFYAKYNKDGNIKIMEDFDGCYFFNTLNKKRSGSVPTTKFLTENMLKSVL